MTPRNMKNFYYARPLPLPSMYHVPSIFLNVSSLVESSTSSALSVTSAVAVSPSITIFSVVNFAELGFEES